MYYHYEKKNANKHYPSNHAQVIASPVIVHLNIVIISTQDILKLYQ